MKITTNSSEHFIATDRGIGGYVSGGVITVLGLFLCLSGSSGVLWGVAGMVLGVVVILLQKSYEVDVDRVGKKITTASRGFLGRKTQTFSYDEIQKVSLIFSEYRQDNYSTNGVEQSSRPVLRSDLILGLKNGNSVRLVFGSKMLGRFASTTSNTPKPNADIGQQLAAVIGVPFEQQEANQVPGTGQTQ